METAKGKTREEAITRLADRIDNFKHYSSPHSRLMADLATHLARRLGLAQPDIHAIAEAAFLHDIGLHAMLPTYQAAPGPLSFEERMDLWRHPIIGEQQMAKRDAMRHAQLLVRWHHEWWNGTGYPDQLSFEDIPIGARILRAVELYSALIADRPYRAALSHEQAIDTLKASAGVECDPYVIKALVALIEDMHAQIEQDEPPPVVEPPLIVEPQAAVEAQVSEARSLPAIGSAQPLSANQTSSDQPVVESETVSSVSTPVAADAANESLSDSRNELRNIIDSWQQGELTTAPLVADGSSESAQSESATPTGESTIPEESTAREAVEPQAEEPRANEPQAGEPVHTPAPLPQSDAVRPSPYADEQVKLRARSSNFVDEHTSEWRGWKGSRYNKKSLLGFEASVLRQIEFRSIAIPFCGWTRLDLYLKTWGKIILANDPRAWAETVARATVEAKVLLNEENIVRVLEDVYVPGARLMNPDLRNWFSETDAWWMDNLRRNVGALGDEALRAQAMMLGMMTGDYALSFNDATRDLRRPLTTVFWRLAGRAFTGPTGHPHNRSYNLPAEDFINRVRADLLYLNLPAIHTARAGAESRSEWRESWIHGAAGAQSETERAPVTAPQSKNAYLDLISNLLRAASNIRVWAIEYQEIGLVTAAEIAELVKEHRPVRATYSKDLTEVVGGLRNYIIVAEKTFKA